MTAAALLVQARLAGGLSQLALARAAGTPQPSIARTERGHRDVNVATLDRLVHAAGAQLAVLPTTRTTAAAAAHAVREALEEGNDEASYRAVIQLANDLAAEAGAERVALCVAPPAPTGDERYDAFIAGVVEHRLRALQLPLPRWLATAARLASPWRVDEWSSDEALAATPRALRERGVIIGEYELESA
jgi:transcriptional regulator with XRE-family HTH domain